MLPLDRRYNCNLLPTTVYTETFVSQSKIHDMDHVHVIY